MESEWQALFFVFSGKFPWLFGWFVVVKGKEKICQINKGKFMPISCQNVTFLI